MKIFSGIQPSGQIHLGNYLGAIKQWIELQNEAEQSIFCIVDLHAITVPQDPVQLQKNILSLAALYLAAGIDPDKSSLFVQSSISEHSELAWILNCNATVGELSRMTQFKDKGGSKNDSVSMGLYDYPVLMAADILLYQTTHVPIGDDQKQHVELTRNIAERFNKKYENIFTMPEPLTKKSSSRILALDNPLKKMSKSAESSYNNIGFTDGADLIRQKITKAVTDSGDEIRIAEDKPAVTNLLNIFHEVSGREISDLESEYNGKGYKIFKDALSDAVINYLSPVQEKYSKLMADPDKIVEILNSGAEKVKPIAAKTLSDVKRVVGLGI